MTDFFIRFTTNAKRDLRRGYSFADWGFTPAKHRCDLEEFEKPTARYSRELGGWIPVLEGLSAAASTVTGNTIEECIEIARNTRYGQLGQMVVFEGVYVGVGGDGEDLFRPIRIIKTIKDKEG